MRFSTVRSSDSVFVIGCPRSGTSAMGHALATHPSFWTSAESNFISAFFRDRWIRAQYDSGTRRQEKHWLVKNKVSYEEYVAYIGWGIDLLYQSRSGGKRWVENTPEYTVNATDLALMFPRAKFIHLVRDGRFVVNSLINSGFSVPYAQDFTLACQTWVRFINKGFEHQTQYPDSTIEIRHEALVGDPDMQCRRILEFLDVEYNDAPANYLKTKRINSSYKDPSIAPKEPWHDWNEIQKIIFNKIAGETMQSLGYEMV